MASQRLHADELTIDLCSNKVHACKAVGLRVSIHVHTEFELLPSCRVLVSHQLPLSSAHMIQR